MLPSSELRCLRDHLAGFPGDTPLWLAGENQVDAARLRTLLVGHAAQIGDFSGRRVALWPSSALDLAFLLVALDGVAESLLLLPSDHPPEQVAALIGRAGSELSHRDGCPRWSGQANRLRGADSSLAHRLAACRRRH